MQTPTRIRQRAAVLVAVLCAASGTAWVVSSQATASATTTATSSTPAAPPIVHPPAGAPRAAATPMTTATNVHCGETITASVTLNGDLNCTGLAGNTAITVAGTSAVTFNLNGHLISSDVSGTCITLQGPGAIVENGTVTDCNWGVSLNGSKETATKLVVGQSTIGILDFGISDKLIANTSLYNGNSGVVTDGVGGTVSGNHIASNTYGLVVQTPGSLVSNNFVDNNTASGIYVYAQGNTFTGNSISYNGGDGFAGNGALSIDGGGNTAHGNDYAGANPEQCSGISCS